MTLNALKGKVVLDFTRNVAGPYCTLILADLGAEVIKIERPDEGDDTRRWGPPFWEGQSAMFLALNRNKKSLVLDLDEPATNSILPRLLGASDVVVQSFRPPSARRLGLDSDHLRAKYPHLVVCDLSAFGPAGPRKDDPAYDPLLQAFGGLMSITGEPDGSPVRVGTSIVDMGTGLWAAIGILAALLDRESLGESHSISASLFETALAWIPYQIVGYLATRETPHRMGTELAQLAPYGAFQTKDDLVVIAVGNDLLWRRLCDAIAGPELIDDPRFRSNPDRVMNRRLLRVELEARLQTRTVAEWLESFAERRVPASAINSLAEIIAHPQTEASQILQECPDSNIEGLRLVGSPLLFDGERPSIRSRPPLLGEHTEELLKTLGETGVKGPASTEGRQ